MGKGTRDEGEGKEWGEKKKEEEENGNKSFMNKEGMALHPVSSARKGVRS